MRKRLIALVIAASFLATCGGRGSLPERAADAPPWGLDSLAIPADRSSIVDAFQALPSDVAGCPEPGSSRSR